MIHSFLKVKYFFTSFFHFIFSLLFLSTGEAGADDVNAFEQVYRLRNPCHFDEDGINKATVLTDPAEKTLGKLHEAEGRIK